MHYAALRKENDVGFAVPVVGESPAQGTCTHPVDAPRTRGNAPAVNASHKTSTAAGVAAILIWSCNLGVSRSLAEKVGALTSGGSMFLIGGTLGCVYAAVVQRRFLAMLRLPRKYLLGCGAMFAAYMVCLYLAVGLASSRQQVLEVGILNYLWPSLTLLLSIPLLKTRTRAAFPLGIVLAVIGAAIAPMPPGAVSVDGLLHTLRSNPIPYLLALCAALLWALYSNLSRRWAAEAEGGAVPLFSLAAGLALLALRPLFSEPCAWSGAAVGELLFMALLPSLIAYSCWDLAMRRGNVTLVASLSYLIPVFATLLGSLYLGVRAGPNLWIACGLIVFGATICQGSVIPGERAEVR